jgi:hypothetical protein
VTGVRGDASNLDDLDRLFDTVIHESLWEFDCVTAPKRLVAVQDPTS